MKEANKNIAPLADDSRPKKIKDFVGQDELVGTGSFLRRAIQTDSVPSMILWGPPGSGKTTLASIIAEKTNSDFVRLSAASSGKKDLLELVERAEKGNRLGGRTILFIDEIHRWNKAQQDALLPHVEKGTVTLIGATTENPSFEVISALVSRSRVFVLKKLSRADIAQILKRAIEEVSRGKKVVVGKDTLSLIANLSNGDARMALNTLEVCLDQNKKVTNELVKEILQKSHLLYDKNGEEHFN